MTDTTHGRPIEPTDVQLSTERTDNGNTPPPPPPPPTPPSVPDPFLPPPRRTTPPPAGPPAAPPARPPAAPPPPRGDGGVAVAAPAPAPTVHHHHYYPAQPAQQDRPPRFSLSRLSPLKNGSALVAGLLLLPVTGKALHICGDEPGVLMAALAAAGILELRKRGRSWPVRVLTCNIVASCFVTPAGLYLLGYLFTGVWS
ncbi:hypothetical protein ABT096_29400 [Streptomyces sp. NPDC002561]|uniref:hypothetical protein n=1 Tax=Streptomyces sp. NPDC002561 TaxID=3154418 RepID=UPI003332FFEA